MPDPEKLKDSTAPFHVALNQAGTSTTPEQKAPAGMKSAKGKGTSSRGPPKRAPGRPRKEVIEVDGDTWFSKDEMTRRYGWSPRLLDSYSNDADDPLAFCVFNGSRYFREKSIALWLKRREAHQTHAHKMKWTKKLAKRNQDKVALVREEIERMRQAGE